MPCTGKLAKRMSPQCALANVFDSEAMAGIAGHHWFCPVQMKANSLTIPRIDSDPAQRAGQALRPVLRIVLLRQCKPG